LIRRYCQITPGFHFLRNNFFFQNKVVGLCIQPDVEDQVPVFSSASNRVAPVYSQAPGSLFVALYDSQGYGGGILTLLHTGKTSSIGPSFSAVPLLRGVIWTPSGWSFWSYHMTLNTVSSNKAALNRTFVGI
jgi:hypothetical protein